MKTVTLDFDTYEAELLAAKQAGMNVAKDFWKNMSFVLRTFSNSYCTKDDYDSSLRILEKAVREYERLNPTKEKV